MDLALTQAATVPAMLQGQPLRNFQYIFRSLELKYPTHWGTAITGVRAY